MITMATKAKHGYASQMELNDYFWTIRSPRHTIDCLSKIPRLHSFHYLFCEPLKKSKDKYTNQTSGGLYLFFLTFLDDVN